MFTLRREKARTEIKVFILLLSLRLRRSFILSHCIRQGTRGSKNQAHLCICKSFCVHIYASVWIIHVRVHMFSLSYTHTHTIARESISRATSFRILFGPEDNIFIFFRFSEDLVRFKYWLDKVYSQYVWKYDLFQCSSHSKTYS